LWLNKLCEYVSYLSWQLLKLIITDIDTACLVNIYVTISGSIENLGAGFGGDFESSDILCRDFFNFQDSHMIVQIIKIKAA